MKTTFISRKKALALSVNGKMIKFNKTATCGVLVCDEATAEVLRKTELYNHKDGYWEEGNPPSTLPPILRGVMTGSKVDEIDAEKLRQENEELKKKLAEIENAPRPYARTRKVKGQENEDD